MGGAFLSVAALRRRATECSMFRAAPMIDPAAAPAKPRPSPSRLELLDGVRGWCALSVVLFHVFWEIFGVATPAFRNPVTGFFFDGDLAVCIFFVLSGEALSAAFFAGGGDAATIRLAIKRYPRLATPILAACLITFALDRLGLVFVAPASRVIPIVYWMRDWLQEPLTFTYAMRYSLVDVFVGVKGGRAIIPMLWTMPIELLGSFVVFAILLMWKRLNRPRTLLLGLFIVATAMPTGSIANYLSCFFAGVAFADWRTQGLFMRVGERLGPGVWAAIVFFAAVDGTLHWFGCESGKTAIAVALMFAVYASPALCAFFSSELSRALGRISFPLYLIQFPVLISVTSWMIVQTGAGGGTLSLSAIWGISLASVAICLLAAIAFAPIERVARSVGDRLIAIVGQDRRSRPTANAPAGS
ncbi:MAG: acyltransferase [Bradyrhizobium sp.]|nr:MAG: acyltransferase [Bradyrhizobium sp.]